MDGLMKYIQHTGTVAWWSLVCHKEAGNINVCLIQTSLLYVTVFYSLY